MFNMLSLWIVNGAIVGSKSEDEHLSISSRLEEEGREREGGHALCPFHSGVARRPELVSSRLRFGHFYCSQ